MPISGTTTFDLDVADIIEEAYEMVGKEVRGGYDLRTARRSLDLLTKEWGNRGINFWTIEEAAAPIMGNISEIQLDSDVIDILDAVWRTNIDTTPYDRILTRISLAEWSQTTIKQMLGLPTQYWVNRLSSAPVAHIWPVPTEGGIFVYWKMRKIQDAGKYTNTMDVPGRFLPAMTAGLAYYLSIKTPGADSRIPVLQAEYERQFMLAAEEDRERASLFLLPGVGR